MLLIDFVMQENHQFEFQFWTDYYFNSIGYGLMRSAVISLTFPIGTFLGSIVINPLLTICPNYASISTIVLLFLGFISYASLGFLSHEIDDYLLYIVFFGLGEFFMIVPYSVTMTSEVAERVESMK